MSKRSLAAMLETLPSGRAFTLWASGVFLACGVLGAGAAMSMIRSGVLVLSVASGAPGASDHPTGGAGASPADGPSAEGLVMADARQGAPSRRQATPLIGRATACAIASYRIGHLAVAVAMDVGAHAHGVGDLLALANARSFERGRTFADIARLLARGGETDPRAIGIVIASSFSESAEVVGVYRASAEYRHLLGRLLYGEAQRREEALGLLLDGFRRQVEPAPSCEAVMLRELEPAIRRRGLSVVEEDQSPRNGAAG